MTDCGYVGKLFYSGRPLGSGKMESLLFPSGRVGNKMRAARCGMHFTGAHGKILASTAATLNELKPLISAKLVINERLPTL